VFSCGDTIYIVGGERESVKSAIGKDESREVNQIKNPLILIFPNKN
jgi:hypothetical protein